MNPSRIIDTHQHVFWHGRDDRGLVADLDEHGIDYAWLLTWEIPPAEDEDLYHAALNPVHARADGTHAGIPLSDLLRARDRYPDRFVLGYCPDPGPGNAPELLRSAAQMHGVQVCGEWKYRLPIDDPRCIELFRAAGELNLPVVFHLDVPWLRDPKSRAGKMIYQRSWYGGTVDNLARALAACPRTTFIGHAPGFWREISADAATNPDIYPHAPVKGRGRLYKLFDTYPNLSADLSAGSGRRALQRSPRHAARFLARYQDRLLFARDYYGGELHAFLQKLNLPRTITEKIYWKNAEKLVSR
ncbi:amidohydrolase family protein [bacterium]|nr:amidohydrolase family protein [bacterium]